MRIDPSRVAPKPALVEKGFLELLPHAMFSTISTPELKGVLKWSKVRPFEGSAFQLRIDNPGRDRSVPWYFGQVPKTDPKTGKAQTLATAKHFYVERRFKGQSTWAGPFPMPVRGLTQRQGDVFVTRLSARQVGSRHLEIDVGGSAKSTAWNHEFSKPIIDADKRTITLLASVLRPANIKGSEFGQERHDSIWIDARVPNTGKWQIRVVDAANRTVLMTKTVEVKP